MALKLSNNADGLLALAISDSDTSLTLRAGDGSRFPELGSGDWFPITVVRASDPSQLEIMRCTARSGDTLTVVRAQEGTSAIAFNAGDVVSLRLTAGTLDSLNAATATKLQTARTLTIGNTGKSFDGSANVSWSLAEIGAARFGILADGTDLNTVINPGFYRLHQTHGNAPASVAYGQLIVARGGGDTILQILAGYRNGEIHWRQGNPPDVGGPGSWSAWHRFFHSGNINAPGSAPLYACRAWVNFNGTGTVAIRGSGNVSSVTDNGTGDYTVNFIQPMPDANYAAVGSCDFEQALAVNPTVMPVSYSVSSVRIKLNARVNSNYPQDSDLISLAVFR